MATDSATSRSPRPPGAPGAVTSWNPFRLARPALLRGQEPRLLDAAVGRLGRLFRAAHPVRHRQSISAGASSSTPLLLTATGYSITLLMAAAYRRLIRMKPIYTWVGSILIVVVAAAGFLGDRDVERRDLHPARHAARGHPLPRRDPAHRLAARRLVGALLQHQFLPPARGAERPAAAAREPGLERPAGDAALPAQPAFPVQHAELDLDPGAAEADRPGQCDAVAAVLLPALYAGQRADRRWSRSRRRSRR